MYYFIKDIGASESNTQIIVIAIFIALTISYPLHILLNKVINYINI